MNVAALALLILATVRPAPPFPGELTLPPRTTVVRTGTIDSDRGEIKAPDGFVIHYDIGVMAGTHMYDARQKECDWFLQHTIANMPARTGVVRVDGKRRVITTIFEPRKQEPANFWATVRNEKDVARFMSIVMTYKPAKR